MEVVRRGKNGILSLNVSEDSMVLAFNGSIVIGMSLAAVKSLNAVRAILNNAVQEKRGLKSTDIMSITLTALSEMGGNTYMMCLPDMEYINGEAFVTVPSRVSGQSICYNFGKEFDKAMSYVASGPKTTAAAELLLALMQRVYANKQTMRAVKVGGELRAQLHHPDIERCETMVIKRKGVEKIESTQTRQTDSLEDRGGYTKNDGTAEKETNRAKEADAWDSCDTCPTEKKARCRLFHIKNGRASQIGDAYAQVQVDPEAELGRIIIERLFGV